MTTELLVQKTERYLGGHSLPAERKQLQNWLSCTVNNSTANEEERQVIEMQILAEVQAWTAYPLFYPKPEPWWRKFTAFF